MSVQEVLVIKVNWLKLPNWPPKLLWIALWEHFVFWYEFINVCHGHSLQSHYFSTISFASAELCYCYLLLLLCYHLINLFKIASSRWNISFPAFYVILKMVCLVTCKIISLYPYASSCIPLSQTVDNLCKKYFDFSDEICTKIVSLLYTYIICCSLGFFMLLLA